MAETRNPNVLVLGTPGSGKSTLCQKVLADLKKLGEEDPSKKIELTHLNIADLIREKKLFDIWDDEMDCSVYDEDLLEQELKNYDFEKGGFLVEFHSCEFFKNAQFDRIFILYTDIDVLAGRLEKRNYSEIKMQENLECEILQIPIFDSYEVFDRDKIDKLLSNTMEDLEKNAKAVLEYIVKYNSQ